MQTPCPSGCIQPQFAIVSGHARLSYLPCRSDSLLRCADYLLRRSNSLPCRLNYLLRRTACGQKLLRVMQYDELAFKGWKKFIYRVP
jgi:hypothetical protein